MVSATKLIFANLELIVGHTHFSNFSVIVFILPVETLFISNYFQFILSFVSFSIFFVAQMLLLDA